MKLLDIAVSAPDRGLSCDGCGVRLSRSGRAKTRWMLVIYRVLSVSGREHGIKIVNAESQLWSDPRGANQRNGNSLERMQKGIKRETLLTRKYTANARHPSQPIWKGQRRHKAVATRYLCCCQSTTGHHEIAYDRT